MYQIGEKVIHTNGGVFIVDSFRDMKVSGKDMRYLCLKPYFIDTQNKTLTIYVPEAKQDELIRPVMSEIEAHKLLDKLREIEPIWYAESKIRKERFSSLLKEGGMDNLCLIMKSLYVQQKKLSENDRSLNLIDWDYLTRLRKEVEEELAISLGVPKEAVPELISKFIDGDLK